MTDVEDQLYVRIRGRVQGPFDLEKLRALVKRGQLSRMHEVSPDGNDWQQAADFPDLFATEVKHTVQAESAKSEDDKPYEPDGPSASWYFSKNDVQSGPVTFEQLQAQASPGKLGPDDLVWKEGMEEWTPARTIPGLLFSAKPKGNADSDTTGKSDRSNGTLLRTLKDSQPWVRFITFTVFLLFAIFTVSGMFLIIIGFLVNWVGSIALGILTLLYAIVFFYGGWLLYSFNTRVGLLLKNESPRNLDHAMQRLRTFWIFISIVLIVLLVNGIAGVILGLSAGGIPFVNDQMADVLGRL